MSQAKLAIDSYPMLRIARNHHQSVRGRPMQFADRLYLVELYRDFPDIGGADIQSAVQTGKTECSIILALERAGWEGRIVAYVLPSGAVRNRFVQNRINPLIASVPTYKQKHKDANKGGKAVDNLGIKKFGKGTILFLGSNTENNFVEFSADVLIIDEYDRCDKRNLDMAWDRVRESPHPQLFRVGNPRLPKVGICARYDETDMRRFMFKCPHCGFMQPIDWFANVVERNDAGNWVARDKKPDGKDTKIQCVSCQDFFHRDYSGAKWLPQRPEMERRGYHISRLDMLSQQISPLVNEWVVSQGDTSKLQAFYNGVLGIGFESASTSVRLEDLEHASGDHEMDSGAGGEKYAGMLVSAGIDVGAVLNIVVSVHERSESGEGIRKAVWVGTAKTFDDLQTILARFHVDLAVMDSRPETHKAQELRDYYVQHTNTSLWLAQFYPSERLSGEAYGGKYHWTDRICSIDRTQLLDATLDDLRAQPTRRSLPRDVFAVEGFVEQMRASQRVLNQTGTRYVWEEGSKPDHYRFADAYDRIAGDLLKGGGTYDILTLDENQSDRRRRY